MDSIDETRPLIVSGGEDIFEITDFTVISDFEQFIVTLENAIHEWNLGTSDANGVKRKTSKRFSNVGFVITFLILLLFHYHFRIFFNHVIGKMNRNL